MTAKFHIRDYKSTDFPQVEVLWNRTGLGGSIRGDNHRVIANTIQSGGKFIVLENHETNELIGTSWITNDARRLYLHHFGIKPEYQGKGLSKPLLEASLAFAKKKNLQIKLEVHQENTIAKKLYVKSGFKYLGDYLVFIIRDVNDI